MKTSTTLSNNINGNLFVPQLSIDNVIKNIKTVNNKEIKVIYSPLQKATSAYVIEEGREQLIKPEDLPKELREVKDPASLQLLLENSYTRASYLSNGDVKLYMEQRGLGGGKKNKKAVSKDSNKNPVQERTTPQVELKATQENVIKEGEFIGNNQEPFLSEPNEKKFTNLNQKEIKVMKNNMSNELLGKVKFFDMGQASEGRASTQDQTIRQISKLIRDGNDYLREYNEKGVLLLGETGAGKSTLANLFSGKKLQAIIDDETGDLVVDAMQPDESIIVGHKMSSATKVPNKIEASKILNKCFAQDLVIWDCPGFNDTDPVQEIANSFYIKRLFETNKYLKFVLVIPEYTLNNNRGTHFLEIVSSFIKTFTDVELISDSISLIITKVPKHKQIQHIKNSIEKILQDNQIAIDSHKSLIKKVIKSSLHLFHKPANEGEIEYIDLLKKMNHVDYIGSNPNMASISVSSKALECSSDLLKAAGSNFNKILEIILIAVTDATNCINSNQNNILKKNQSIIIKDWIPASMHHKVLSEHNSDEYFVELDLLSKLHKILNINAIDGIPSAITVLQRAIETIAEYASDVRGTNIKEQIEEYGYCLQQQYEYVKFFASVCKASLPTHNNLLELIKACSIRVEDNLKYQVANLEIDKEQPADYYLKAIKYLSNYPKSEECIKLKAVCYTNLANIAEQQKDDIKATQYYLAAIEANKQIPEVYEKLGQLFTNKQAYSKAIDCYKVVNNEFGIKHCFKKWLKLEPKNPEIILKQANYFESIGIFDKAKLYYHHVFSLTQDESVKAEAWNKIGNILTNTTDLGESFIERADAHHFFNYEIVDGSFIKSLVGETVDFSS